MLNSLWLPAGPASDYGLSLDRIVQSRIDDSASGLSGAQYAAATRSSQPLREDPTPRRRSSVDCGGSGTKESTWPVAASAAPLSKRTTLDPGSWFGVNTSVQLAQGRDQLLSAPSQGRAVPYSWIHHSFDQAQAPRSSEPRAHGPPAQVCSNQAPPSEDDVDTPERVLQASWQSQLQPHVQSQLLQHAPQLPAPLSPGLRAQPGASRQSPLDLRRQEMPPQPALSDRQELGQGTLAPPTAGTPWTARGIVETSSVHPKARAGMLRAATELSAPSWAVGSSAIQPFACPTGPGEPDSLSWGDGIVPGTRSEYLLPGDLFLGNGLP